MLRNIMRSLSWFTALCLALCLPAVAEATGDDPTVVRVGQFSYPLSVVQGSLDSALDLASLLSGEEVTDEDRKSGIQAAIDKFVNLGVIECKLTEKGKNDFSEDEVELMKAAAQAKYEELWQSLYQRASKSGEEVSEEDITGWLEGEGYTVEAIYDEYEVSERNHRAIELFCPDVTLTQAQVDAYYEEQFVGPDRERYKDNVERFEEEIVAGNNEAFYIPEGYRYIRQITLDYPKAATAAAKAQENRMKNALNALASRFQKLAVAATTAEGWDDLKDLRAEYDKANEVVAEAQTAWMEKVKAGAQPLLQETFDAIAEEVRGGHRLQVADRKVFQRQDRHEPFEERLPVPPGFHHLAGRLQGGGHEAAEARRHQRARVLRDRRPHPLLRGRGPGGGPRADGGGAGAAERQRPAILPERAAFGALRPVEGRLRNRDASRTAGILKNAPPCTGGIRR